MLVRLAKKEDFEGVFGLLHELWPHKIMHEDKIQRIYNRYMNDSSKVLLVYGKTAVIGMAALSFMEDFKGEGPVLYLHELIVKEEFRGQGIGSTLLKKVESLAKGKCHYIWLDSAFYRKKAHKFYKKHNYKKTDYGFEKIL